MKEREIQDYKYRNYKRKGYGAIGKKVRSITFEKYHILSVIYIDGFKFHMTS
jgi:hypothetical protein